MSKTIAPKTRKENNVPDTADAEQWLDADRFKFKGNIYRIVNNVVQKEG